VQHSFRDEFRSKFISIDEALLQIKDCSRVVASMAAAEPRLMFENLHRRAADVIDVEVHCANPDRDYPCFTDPSMAGHLDLHVMFLTSAIRKQHGHGAVHYVPQHLSNWFRNMSRQGPIDIFWGSCTPPDERGFVSLGPGACYETESLRAAKFVILEVNPNLPYTYGSTHVPISWVHAFVESTHSLPHCEPVVPDETDHRIASHVSGLIENGSTIQLGIGGIPNAVGMALRMRRDLGVHTELINDAIMDLYQAGIINGRFKTLWPGKIVGAFIFGTQKLYEFCDRNPVIELQPSSVVNDPYRIGRNHRMISINTAVEIDITGQVCSESIGHRQLSGVGGATDTHVGAQRSEGGRGIIAMRSTTDDGKFSKIVFELKPGAKVSISRNDIDTVVTEFGVARLAGKSVAQRIRALVNIAHPQFRDLLLSQAKATNYL
jgi:acyl-CoA hydrolase